MTNALAPLWRADALAPVMGGRLSGPVRDVTSVSIDTRTLESGALFCAIKGERDGHDFVVAALQKGSAAALVDEAHAAQFAADAPLVIVPDVLVALEKLGRSRRADMRGPVIAVTGSVGKTTTKEMLRTVFSRLGQTHASVASYNNHWGVPLTLARMPGETEFGIFEIGMNHSFEILPLTAMVRPHIAMVTTVEPVHLAQFPSLSAIADAKGEIFSGLEPGGVAIINADNPQAARLVAHAGASRAGRIIRFGSGEQADIRLTHIHLDPDFSTVTAEVFGVPVTYRLGAPGRHLAMNSLAVLAAVHAAGGDLALAALALQDFTTVEGRGQRAILQVGEGSFTLIDESYNANPSSMKAALAVTGSFSKTGHGRRIAVIGDMLELGVEGANLHAGLADAVLASGIDLVHAAGPLSEALWKALPVELRGVYAPTSVELEPHVLSSIRAGDVVMIKGSNGSRMGRIVSALKARFPAQTREM